MKSLIKIGLICLIALAATGSLFPRKAAAQPGVSVPVESFYNELAPYGQWIQHPGYGAIWLPNAGPDFQPYASAGHWIVTEYGNTWVSDYAWGWAPFHYGRWIFDQAYGGWLWIPDSDWGPAWVSWRTGGGYYGWAPLGPGVNVNVNINIPAPYWTFVPQIYITSPQLYSYRVARPQVINIYQNTTIINNVYRSNNRAYVYGPPRGDIERITRRPVQVYRVDALDRPGRSVVSNGSVGFYRPNPANNYGGNNRGFNDNRYNDNRGNNGNNRSYNDNRGYNGNDRNNAPAPNYGNNYPGDRRGGAVNTPNTPNPGSYPGGYSTPNRPEPNRGYGNGNGNNAVPNGNGQPQSGGYPQQPNRSYEQRSAPTQQVPQAPQNQGQQGQRPNGGPERMPESRTPENRINTYPQRGQEQRGNPGARTEGAPGGGNQRGPR